MPLPVPEGRTRPHDQQQKSKPLFRCSTTRKSPPRFRAKSRTWARPSSHFWKNPGRKPWTRSSSSRLENLIHHLQFEGLQQRLRVWREAGAPDLLEGMWLLNSYQYPDADLQALNRAIEQLRFEAWTLLRPEMHPADQVQVLNHVMFPQPQVRGQYPALSTRRPTPCCSA
ncbi:MAG: hypothetical protein WKG07_49675 [Hymenobacter sp.]